MKISSRKSLNIVILAFFVLSCQLQSFQSFVQRDVATEISIDKSTTNASGVAVITNFWC